MKIAVLLFGHLRTFEFCSKYLKKFVLDKYNCDVFIHTWDEIDSQTVSWNNKTNVKQNINEQIKEKMLAFYSPVSYKISKQIEKPEIIVTSDITGKKTSLNGMNFMFESLNEANNLRKEYEKETNTKYDLVFVTRPDIAILRQLPDFKKVNDEAEAIGLNLENTRFFCGLSNASKANVTIMCHRGCDMLFWGKPNAINIFIQSNLNLTTDSIKSAFYNVCSIYAANEIKNGNNPQLVCFVYGKDWKIIRFNDLLLNDGNKVENKQPQQKEKSKIYKFLHLYWLRGKK